MNVGCWSHRRGHVIFDKDLNAVCDTFNNRPERIGGLEMVEIRGDKRFLLPVSAEDLKDIKIGDIVWLDGDLMTCRDVAHRRLVEYGRASL